MIRNAYKTKIYTRIMKHKCANPNCESGLDAEGHHIVPLKNGGEDKFWNFVCLCSKCHRYKGIHSKWEESKIEMYVWKSLQEIELLGFYLDEESGDFYENYKKALLSIRQE